MEKPSGASGRRIRRVSVVMVWLTAALVVLLAVGYVWIVLSPVQMEALVRRTAVPMATPIAIGGAVRGGLAVAGLVPLALTEWGLVNAVLLFHGYRRGAVFTETAGRRLTRMGAALTPLAVAIATGLASVLATMGNEPGERQLALSVSSDHLIAAVAGVLLIVIGWVMTEAARIADENRQFV